MIIGTPVDEHLNPSFVAIDRALAKSREHLRNGQPLIPRSTVFPGTSQRIQRVLTEWGLRLSRLLPGAGRPGLQSAANSGSCPGS